jgi:hypothetical protein
MGRLDAALNFGKEMINAEGNESPPDVRSDQEAWRVKGKGRKNRASKDRNGAGNWEAAKGSKIPTFKELTHALHSTDGSVTGASARLKVSVGALDAQVRTSRQLQKYLATIPIVHDPVYTKERLAQVEEDIKVKALLYRSDALTALHSLATMEVNANTNSALAQVKLLAAQRLYQETSDAGAGPGEIESTLRILNERFQEAAPRIKAIRERIVEFENGAPRLIEASSSTSE